MTEQRIQRVPSVRPYLVGYVLALVLTACPFALVWAKAWSSGILIAVIAAFAAGQALVHLRYFLHVGVKSTPWQTRLSLALAVVIIAIFITGSMVVMNDLAYRMMQ
jgi:cytochrome o ubiquinol oxidase subunit IV